MINIMLSAIWLLFAIIASYLDMKDKKPISPWVYVAVICSTIWAAK